MAHELMDILSERITSGLKRKAITTCSEWAKAYRVMGQPFPGKWSFLHHPWVKDMHDCTAERLVGQKAAQMGFTEVALNKTFYYIDVKGTSVLYVLPASNPDASDFSTSRFDPALDLSDHLRYLFSDVKNIGHKRAGSANLFIRGSRSRSQLKSVPVGFMIFDEVDEMVQENIPLAFERTSGQLEKQIYLLSTPTIPRFGINAYYINSSQDHYFFVCPHCSRLTELIYPDCFVMVGEDINDPRLQESYVQCKECKTKLTAEEKAKTLLETGRWVSGKTDRLVRGFYINQLYSKTIRPYELAEAIIRSQYNPADEQELYNSKLGETRLVEGAKVTDEQIDGAIGHYQTQDTAPLNSLITMGVDVGKWLHVEIDQWFLNDGEITSTDVSLMTKCRVLKQTKVLNFEELDLLIHQFGVNFTVIDANPEKRKAMEFANRFFGRVKLCYYARGVAAKQIHVNDEDEHTVSVDRTSWLDVSLGRFRTKKITIPANTNKEYKDHIKEPSRVYEKDKDGNPVGRYISIYADHYAHARNYAEIALPLAGTLMGNQDINGIY